MNSGVYVIKNKINDKVYIGSSINIKKRWKEHINSLQKKSHANFHLQRAWDTYGKEAFEFSIEEECKVENLLAVEQRWLDEYKSYNIDNGYNICENAGNTLGRKHTDESRKKISINHHDVIGKNNPMFGVPSPNSGKKHTTETKKKISDKLKGKKSWSEGKTKHTDPIVKQISDKLSGERNYFYGKTHSEETKLKMSIQRRGDKSSNSKLTWEDVRKIRELKKQGLSNRKIGAIFSVSGTTIFGIVNNLSWKEE